MVKNGCGQSGYKTLKLNVSQVHETLKFAVS